LVVPIITLFNTSVVRVPNLDGLYAWFHIFCLVFGIQPQFLPCYLADQQKTNGNTHERVADWATTLVWANTVLVNF